MTDRKQNRYTEGSQFPYLRLGAVRRHSTRRDENRTLPRWDHPGVQTPSTSWYLV